MTAIAESKIDFEADEVADFRRAVWRLRVMIGKCYVAEKAAKERWLEARRPKKAALADLLHQAATGKTDDVLAKINPSADHPVDWLLWGKGFDARVLLAHKMLAEAVEQERKARQEFAMAITARRRAVDELTVFLTKWTERLPLFAQSPKV